MYAYMIKPQEFDVKDKLKSYLRACDTEKISKFYLFQVSTCLFPK